MSSPSCDDRKLSNAGKSTPATTKHITESAIVAHSGTWQTNDACANVAAEVSHCFPAAVATWHASCHRAPEWVLAKSLRRMAATISSGARKCFKHVVVAILISIENIVFCHSGPQRALRGLVVHTLHTCEVAARMVKRRAHVFCEAQRNFQWYSKYCLCFWFVREPMALHIRAALILTTKRRRGQLCASRCLCRGAIRSLLCKALC